MAFRYLSTEWMTEARKRVEASKEFSQTAQGVDASLLNVITEAPGGKTLHLYYAFKAGKVSDMAAGPDPAIAKRPHEFTATGTYETYAAINQGKLNLTQAVLQRRLKLEGNLGKALRHVKPLEVFNRIVQTVPAEY